MSDAVRIYHNPRCSKSRETLKLLEDQGLSPEVVLYLETPPTTADLQTLLSQLGLTARELLRKGEDAYKELNLANPELREAELIQAMIDHPKLIERPIVVKDGKAKLGRPPEAVLSLLD